MMKNFFLIVLLIGCFINSFSQDNTLFDKIKQSFPQEQAVYVEQTETVNIDVEGDSLRIFTAVFEDLLHLKEQSGFYSDKKVYGSHFSEVDELEAKTLVWDKSKYRSVSVSDFKRNSNAKGSVFYDDSYYYTFDFPSVAPRNRTQISYKRLFRDSRLLPVHFFQSYLPVVSSSFIIKAPAEVDLYYQVVNDPDKTISFRKYQKGKIVFYEWKGANLDAFKVEELSPALNYYSPQVVYYVRSFKGKSGNTNMVLSDLNALHAWYRTFVQDLDNDHSQDLTDIVGKLMQKSTSELDLVRNIFYWAQDNIEYIAFEEGMRGFIPHSASYTCEKRYGDCKDMANLIVGMLSLAGKKCYHTWVGSRDLPYKYSEFSSPIVDNHMIATYISDNGEYYFLDATGDYTPLGYPSSMIQGKEVLISYGHDKFEVRTIPVIEKEKNVMTDSMSIELVENELRGKGACTLSGFPKSFGGSELNRAGDADIKQYVTKLMGKGNNKFFLDQYKVLNVLDQDLPTRIEYDFRIRDYFQVIGDEIYLNLNLNKEYFNYLIRKETRKTPVEIDYKYIKEEVIELKIPEGFQVEYVPNNLVYQGKFLGCNIGYQSDEDGRKITMTKKFFVDTILIVPDYFDMWNEDIKKLSESYKESIILIRK